MVEQRFQNHALYLSPRKHPENDFVLFHIRLRKGEKKNPNLSKKTFGKSRSSKITDQDVPISLSYNFGPYSSLKFMRRCT